MLKSLKREKGATMIEYALVVGLITIAALTVLSQVGQQVSSSFQRVHNELASVNAEGGSGGGGSGSGGSGSGD